MPEPVPNPLTEPNRTGPNQTTHAERAREPEPDRGFSTTPTSPQVEPPTGRSRRLHALPDPSTADATGETQAQAAAAHRLELALGCAFTEAHKAVQVLVTAGADMDWITERVAKAKHSTAKPWDWAKAAKTAWLDHTESVQA